MGATGRERAAESEAVGRDCWWTAWRHAHSLSSNSSSLGRVNNVHLMLPYHQQGTLGYRLLADEVLTMDALNPQVASRLVRPLTQLARIEGERARLMRTELERIAAKQDLSADVREIVSAAL